MGGVRRSQPLRMTLGGLDPTDPWLYISNVPVTKMIEVAGFKDAHAVQLNASVALVFAAAAAVAPWTVYLAVPPQHYTAHHYWLGWFGFDVALLVVLVITGRSLSRREVAACRYATVAAAVLVADAWFDVLNAATPTEQLVAVALAGLVELPLAYVCWRIARTQPATDHVSSRHPEPVTRHKNPERALLGVRLRDVNRPDRTAKPRRLPRRASRHDHGLPGCAGPGRYPPGANSRRQLRRLRPQGKDSPTTPHLPSTSRAARAGLRPTGSPARRSPRLVRGSDGYRDPGDGHLRQPATSRHVRGTAHVPEHCAGGDRVRRRRGVGGGVGGPVGPAPRRRVLAAHSSA